MTRVRKDVRAIWHACLTDNKMSVQRHRRIYNAFLGTIITADRFKGVSHFVFTFLLRSRKYVFLHLRWIGTLLTALSL